MRIKKVKLLIYCNFIMAALYTEANFKITILIKILMNSNDNLIYLFL